MIMTFKDGKERLVAGFTPILNFHLIKQTFLVLAPQLDILFSPNTIQLLGLLTKEFAAEKSTPPLSLVRVAGAGIKSSIISPELDAFLNIFNVQLLFTD